MNHATFRFYAHLNDFGPFSRCLVCNGRLHRVSKESVEDLLPPGTQEFFDEFFQCERCEKVYWKGSHYDRMAALVDEIKNSRL